MEDLVLSCLESRVEENRNAYARFLIAPFVKGEALTVGTALRRALLSSVESIGITALSIQGITHEFSSIVGVRESVLELSLNFQKIVLRGRSSKRAAKRKAELSARNLSYRQACYRWKEESEQSKHTQYFCAEKIELGKQICSNKDFVSKVQVGYLQVQGPLVVYANDLKLPDGIECVDPTQYIATLSTEALLVVKFLIGKSFDAHNYPRKISCLGVHSSSSLFQKLPLGNSLFTAQNIFKAKTFSPIQRSCSKGLQSLPCKASKGLVSSDMFTFPLAYKASFGSAHKQVQNVRSSNHKISSEKEGTTLSRKLILNEKLTSKALRKRKQKLIERFASKEFSQFDTVQRFAKASLLQKVRKGSVGKEVVPLHGIRNSKEKQDFIPFCTRKKMAFSTNFQSSFPYLQMLPAFATKPSKLIQKLPFSSGKKAVCCTKIPCFTKAKKEKSEFFQSDACFRNIIPLDSLLTPIKQVNFVIENDDEALHLYNKVRERIILEVWTNGSISPRQAVHEAALSLIDTFSSFRNVFKLNSSSSHLQL